MAQTISIRKGMDIRLAGVTEKIITDAPKPSAVAIKPSDYHGLIPKLRVKQGDHVQAGTPLFHDKYNEKVLFVSPVSGELTDIVRGEKRRILELRIKPSENMEYVSFSQANPDSLGRDEIIDALLNAGLWPFIRQRPYSIIASPEDTPKAIHISAFDTAPLAADPDFLVHNRGEEFNAGLKAISKLTDKVHLNIHAQKTVSEVFTQAPGVQINRFSGPHPSGLVGVQIHHIDPINMGEKHWYLHPDDVCMIGRFFNTGKVDMRRIIAVGGSGVKHPKYYKTILGVRAKDLIAEDTNEGDFRYISGDVLTGDRIDPDGYLGFYHHSLALIPEDHSREFFGWMAPGFNKLSLSRSFCSWMTPSKVYNLNTKLNGEERAFVMTQQYEKVFPFDIYPVYLIKAMLNKDIDSMEGLGIYEVAPEDFALCEFVCTSKIPVQKIVREALDLVHSECG